MRQRTNVGTMLRSHERTFRLTRVVRHPFRGANHKALLLTHLPLGSARVQDGQRREAHAERRLVVVHVHQCGGTQAIWLHPHDTHTAAPLVGRAARRTELLL